MRAQNDSVAAAVTVGADTGESLSMGNESQGAANGKTPTFQKSMLLGMLVATKMSHPS